VGRKPTGWRIEVPFSLLNTFFGFRLVFFSERGLKSEGESARESEREREKERKVKQKRLD
jgi:hypothetical protein